VSPREIYWNDRPIDLLPGKTVCSSLLVDKDSDFKTSGLIHFNPQIIKADPKQLKITLSHANRTVLYSPTSDTESWSKWDETFIETDAQRQTWDLCVTSEGSPGSLIRWDLELQKK
jgi:hypothetical protein